MVALNGMWVNVLSMFFLAYIFIHVDLMNKSKVKQMKERKRFSVIQNRDSAYKEKMIKPFTHQLWKSGSNMDRKTSKKIEGLDSNILMQFATKDEIQHYSRKELAEIVENAKKRPAIDIFAEDTIIEDELIEEEEKAEVKKPLKSDVPAWKQRKPPASPPKPNLMAPFQQNPLFQNPATKGKSEPLVRGADQASLNVALSGKASDGTVMVMATDFFNVFDFLYYHSYNRLKDYNYFLAVFFEEKAMRTASRNGILGYLYDNFIMGHGGLFYNSRDSANLFNYRSTLSAALCHDILALKKDVVMIFSYTLLFRDPLPFLKGYRMNDDQRERGLVAPGLLYVRSSAQSIAYYACVAKQFKLSHATTQRGAHKACSTVGSEGEYTAYPEEVFLDPKAFKQHCQFSYHLSRLNEKVLTGLLAPTLSFSNRRFILYELGYEINKSDTYFGNVFEHFLLVNQVSQDVSTQLKLLGTIAVSLHRTIIMPKLPCPELIPLKKCNLCSYSDDCFASFQEMVKKQIKPNFYLSDKRVNKQIAQDLHSAGAYEIVCGATVSAISGSKIYVKKGASINHFLVLLSQLNKERVIRLGSLPSCLSA